MNSLQLALASGILLLLVTGFSPVWTQTGAPTNFLGAVAMSADGRVICALSSVTQPVVSTNSGAGWLTNTTSTHGYFGIAVSANGTQLTMGTAEKPLLVSTNSGTAWFQNASTASDWRGIACSADGVKIFAAIFRGSIIFSTNSGSTWAPGTAPNNPWSILASSADGTRLLAATTANQIYISTNSGLNWLPSAVGGYAGTVSADGSKMVVVGNSTYVSADLGTTWATNAIGGYAVAASANGKSLFVAGLDGSLYTSYDFGMDWNSSSFPTNIADVASSADGSRLVAVGRGIWTAQVPPSPQLNLVPVNGGLACSWIWPSTNFVLQQNRDLTTANWLTVTNLPVFNLTNLQAEVGLSPTNSSGFFRLISN